MVVIYIYADLFNVAKIKMCSDVLIINVTKAEKRNHLLKNWCNNSVQSGKSIGWQNSVKIKSSDLWSLFFDLVTYACTKNKVDKVKFQNENNIFYDRWIKWRLVICLQKCKHMYFEYNNHFINIICALKCWIFVVKKRVLGVLISYKLTFKDHLYMSVKKASHVCNKILSEVHIFEKISYKTYARPYLDYHCSVMYSLYHLINWLFRKYSMKFYKWINLS